MQSACQLVKARGGHIKMIRHNHLQQLEDNIDYPKMKVIEIEDDIMIKTCELHGHKYAIITPDDIIVPPDEGMKHDYI